MTDKPKKKPGRKKGITRKALTTMHDIEQIEKVGGEEKAKKIIQDQFKKL